MATFPSSCERSTRRAYLLTCSYVTAILVLAVAFRFKENALVLESTSKAKIANPSSISDNLESIIEDTFTSPDDIFAKELSRIRQAPPTKATVHARQSRIKAVLHPHRLNKLQDTGYNIRKPVFGHPRRPGARKFGVQNTRKARIQSERPANPRSQESEEKMIWENMEHVAELQLQHDTSELVRQLGPVFGGEARAGVTGLRPAWSHLQGDFRLLHLLQLAESEAEAADIQSAESDSLSSPVNASEGLLSNETSTNETSTNLTNATFEVELPPCQRPNLKGEEALICAGVETDRWPGLGEHYADAIPLPIFSDSWSKDNDRLSNVFKVNVQEPNPLFYSSDPSTPQSEKSSGDFHYADGLDDDRLDAVVAARHEPLSFLLHDPRRGSEKLENASINVWGAESVPAAFVRDLGDVTFGNPLAPDDASAAASAEGYYHGGFQPRTPSGRPVLTAPEVASGAHPATPVGAGGLAVEDGSEAK